MGYVPRAQEPQIRAALRRGKSVLLLGARQTGKTTLIQRFEHDLSISLVRPDVRQRYEREPAVLAGEVEALTGKSRLPLVLIDEVQRVPVLLDVVQDLIDRQVAIFVLTGSSARKLRRGSETNLLPGRVVVLRLDPLTVNEIAHPKLNDLITFGSLPGILTTEQPRDRDLDLESYVTTYLEEEVRAEAVVRNLGPFARFLELAAAESGSVINLRKLSQEIGVAHTTIASYFEILQDCLIAERIEPLSESKTRRKLTKTARYLFFDLGVRRAAAREGLRMPKDMPGRLFEQFVGLELLRCARLGGGAQLRFWRDPDGPEVDWVIERGREYTPVEVKWTAAPTDRDIRHLEVFLGEYTSARQGYVICRTPRRVKLSNAIYALPWQDVDSLVRS